MYLNFYVATTREMRMVSFFFLLGGFTSQLVTVMDRAIVPLLLFEALVLLPICVGVSQTAGFTCMKDFNNDTLLHIDFRLDRKDDIVNLLYAYDASTDKPLRQCKATTTDGKQTFQMRVTLITDGSTQTAPSDSCGVKLTSPDLFELHVRSEASEDLVVASDRIYKCKCNSSESFRPWVETTGIQVGNVDLVNLTSTTKIKLEIFKADDLLSRVTFAYLGDKVKFKFTMEYTSQIEGIAVVGARLKNLICSPSDTFSPIKRTLIDDNGCPVAHTTKALSLDGPFTTESNGSSPFIAISPVMEIGKFSDSHELNFLVHLEYCTSTTSACFTNMCVNRRRRSTTDIKTASFSTKIIVRQRSESSGNSSDEETSNCFLTLNFALVMSVVAVLLSLDGCVIVYLVLKLKSISRSTQSS